MNGCLERQHCISSQDRLQLTTMIRIRCCVLMSLLVVANCTKFPAVESTSTQRRQRIFSATRWGQSRHQLWQNDEEVASPVNSITCSYEVPTFPTNTIQSRNVLNVRGGDTSDVDRTTLDQKVHAAMRKLGLTPPGEEEKENIKSAVDTSDHAVSPRTTTIPPPPPPPPPRKAEPVVATTQSSTAQADALPPPNVVCEDGVCEIPTQQSDHESNSMQHPPPLPSDDIRHVEANIIGPPLPPDVPPPRIPQVYGDASPSTEGVVGDSNEFGSTNMISEQDSATDEEIHVFDEFGQEEQQQKSSQQSEDGDEFFDKVQNAIQKMQGLQGQKPEDAREDATEESQQDPEEIAVRISKDLSIDPSIAWAALLATSTVTGDKINRKYNEAAARNMIQLELEMIDQISADSIEVEQLVSEGHDTFLSRRALAFAEGNVEDARAILLADRQDEQEEIAKQAVEDDRLAKENSRKIKKESEASFKTVEVKPDFDPSTIGTKDVKPPPLFTQNSNTKPKEASKDSVVFEATSSQLLDLVFESPVPVLLDIYADWCGPCKALSPVLEDMAVKSGGAFRLVKVNSDNERSISTALQVTGLPTVFGVRDGKILHMFQGMPRSEEMMRNFMMGLLIPGQLFNPPVTKSEEQNYIEMSTKLLRLACAASYPFSARERLAERVTEKLNDLLKETGGNVLVAEESAQTIRTLLSNIIKNPFDVKYRNLNLENKIIAEKIVKFPACLTILKGAGFSKDIMTEKPTMTIGKGKKAINLAPITIVRDSIDKWIDVTRNEVSKAARKRKDEVERQRLKDEEAKRPPSPVEEVEDEPKVDPNLCTLNVRLEGKKKVYELEFHADDTLATVLEKMPKLPRDNSNEDGVSVFQITCVAKKLVVSSSDESVMTKSLRSLKLFPTAALVIANTSRKGEPKEASKLSERSAKKIKRKKGSHTMQSIGIYAKDDNAKGELIDGGGGTLYEHDVSDDETDELKPSSSQDDVEADQIESPEETAADSVSDQDIELPELLDEYDFDQFDADEEAEESESIED